MKKIKDVLVSFIGGIVANAMQVIGSNRQIQPFDNWPSMSDASKASTARNASTHNPAGTKLARHAREGRLGRAAIR